MAAPRVFIIALDNHPGALAAVLRPIADHGVSIITGGTATWGEHGAIALQFDDDDRARAALEEAGATFREVAEVVAYLEPDPGTLAGATERLAAAGVNIEALAPIELHDGRVGVLFGVDNPEAAAAALGDDVVSNGG